MVERRMLPMDSAMYRLYLILSEHPELAAELPALPCSVRAVLALDDDENPDTTPASPLPLRLAA
jgi:hypothetical protein